MEIAEARFLWSQMWGKSFFYKWEFEALENFCAEGFKLDFFFCLRFRGEILGAGGQAEELNEMEENNWLE